MSRSIEYCSSYQIALKELLCVPLEMLQNSDNLFSHLTEYVAGETAFRLQVQSKELLSVGKKELDMPEQC